MDNLTKAQRRKNMQNIRSSRTTPERKLAKSLRTHSLYFAQNVASLPGKPDIVFRKRKIAVFVDSDFWHMNSKRFIMPDTNLDYWKPKIKRNIKRDKEVNKMLRKAGWRVLRFWEYDVKRNTAACAKKVLNTLAKSSVARPV